MQRSCTGTSDNSARCTAPCSPEKGNVRKYRTLDWKRIINEELLQTDESPCVMAISQNVLDWENCWCIRPELLAPRPDQPPAKQLEPPPPSNQQPPAQATLKPLPPRLRGRFLRSRDAGTRVTAGVTGRGK